MRHLSFVIRPLLFPFALLYGLIVRLRHRCYNVGIFKVHTFAVPTICVGNVAVGGYRQESNGRIPYQAVDY